MAAVIVIVPVAVSTAWLAAAIQNALEQTGFLQAMVSLLLSGTLTALVSVYGLVYPLERWVVRNRAVKSRGWLMTRMLLYIAAGIPIGLILILGIRLGTARRSLIVESSYVVIAVANVGMIGLVYSFFERVAEEVQEREAQLQQQINLLRIEIDEVARSRQVKEIVETDYFQDLSAKAREMRLRVQPDAVDMPDQHNES